MFYRINHIIILCLDLFMWSGVEWSGLHLSYSVQPADLLDSVVELGLGFGLGLKHELDLNMNLILNLDLSLDLSLDLNLNLDLKLMK